MARKHEKTAKANADAAAKLAAIEDAAKSEAERLAEQAAQAEQRAAQAEIALARLRVAAAKGLPADLAERLVGTSEDELAEDADRLLTLVKPPEGAPSRPAGSADNGPQGAPDPSKPKQLTHDDVKAMTPDAINAARAAGQLDELLGITP
jgi:hypothetical protein